MTHHEFSQQFSTILIRVTSLSSMKTWLVVCTWYLISTLLSPTSILKYRCSQVYSLAPYKYMNTLMKVLFTQTLINNDWQIYLKTRFENVLYIIYILLQRDNIRKDYLYDVISGGKLRISSTRNHEYIFFQLGQFEVCCFFFNLIWF